MEIVLRARKGLASSLPAGTVFTYNGEFFMKIDTAFYAVNLKTGKSTRFSDDMGSVELVEAELHVTV